MREIQAAIVGAGQAGLAMSRCLAVLGIDHVVFDRGRVAERWRTTTWDSLRMLTPNWLNGLPWQPYDGADTHGYMSRDEIVAFLDRYRRRLDAPVLENTPVISLAGTASQFRLDTPGGAWRARAVIVATGYCDHPRLPVAARGLSSSLHSMHSSAYRRPGDLPPGGVLVVGASPSGLQIAEDIRAAGRKVVLSVGRHMRMPRRWRGRDIFWWLTALGKLADRASDMPDLDAEIEQSNMQLVGRPDQADLDLPRMQALGIRLTGRLVGADGHDVAFADDLGVNTRIADERMLRILGSIDRHCGRSDEIPSDFARIDLSDAPERLSLRAEGITSVIWATGFRRDFPWMRLPVLRQDGDIAQRGGVTDVPGLFTLGYRFQCKRDSHFLGGVGTDAMEIAGHVARHLETVSRRAA